MSNNACAQEVITSTESSPGFTIKKSVSSIYIVAIIVRGIRVMGEKKIGSGCFDSKNCSKNTLTNIHKAVDNPLPCIAP